MKPSRKYAIESCYMGGDNAPWQGWKVTRIYPSADARDEDLKRLRALASATWAYRIRRD
jgi:hypothetical protein